MLPNASRMARTPALNKTCWLSWPDGASVGFVPLTVEVFELVPLTVEVFEPEIQNK